MTKTAYSCKLHLQGILANIFYKDLNLHKGVFMMKIYIWFLLLFAISSAGICQNVFFFYDFNNDEVGKPPSGPWKMAPAGKVEVEKFPSVTNKSVKITDSGSGGGMSLILDEPIVGKTVSLEFKWYREEGDATGVEVFYVLHTSCPDDWAGVCVKTENGSFQYNDAGTWFDAVKFQDKKWYDFKYIMYLDKNKYDFVLDGKEIATNAGFRKYEGLGKPGINKFNVANYGNGGSTFIMYFDDIILYEGKVRSIAVESKSKLATVWGSVKVSMIEDRYFKYPGGHKGTRFEKGIDSKSKFTL